jgi:hypothetical protein
MRTFPDSTSTGMAQQTVLTEPGAGFKLMDEAEDSMTDIEGGWWKEAEVILR